MEDGVGAAKRFVENIPNLKNSHKVFGTGAEKDGSIEDYTVYQNQKDLETYKSFLSSFAYDDVKEAEEQIKKPTAMLVKKL